MCLVRVQPWIGEHLFNSTLNTILLSTRAFEPTSLLKLNAGCPSTEVQASYARGIWNQDTP